MTDEPDLVHALGDTPEEFEGRVRDNFPDFYEQVVPRIDAIPPIQYRGLPFIPFSAACGRCQAVVQTSDTERHSQWHRHLTLTFHLNAWLVRECLQRLEPDKLVPVLQQAFGAALADDPDDPVEGMPLRDGS